jgi:hypothetical protein
MNVYVLDLDLLLAFAAIAIERVEQQGKGADELASLIQIIPEEPACQHLAQRPPPLTYAHP